jgi:hypothetical protein
VSNGFRKHGAGFPSARRHIFGRDKCCYPCRAGFTPSNACDQDLDQGYLWEQAMDTDMSRSEKIVTSLSVAVLVAGFATAVFPKSANTSVHGSIHALHAPGRHANAEFDADLAHMSKGNVSI